jgi:FAD:protein FMN transferase
MEAKKKNAIIASALVLILFIGYLYLNGHDNTHDPENLVSFTGETMGTIYSIKYLDTQKRDFKPEVDSLLKVFNQSLSTYEKASEISIFNISDSLNFKLPFFLPVLQKSKQIWEETEGAFDPTIMPLVNLWGFGPAQRSKVDSIKVDSLLNLVGFDKILFDSTKVYKAQPNVQLDFSAIAKGYGVDVVSNYLISHNIENLMVEIGGELYCEGKNERGQYWLIGIDNPEAKGIEDYLKAKISIRNRAVATSGNYRNYYKAEGKTIAHTISPFTGFPTQREIISASVFADICMEADAYATAFLVLGLDKAKQILEENVGMDAYLIYRDEQDSLKTFYTAGIEQYIK